MTLKELQKLREQEERKRYLAYAQNNSKPKTPSAKTASASAPSSGKKKESTSGKKESTSGQKKQQEEKPKTPWEQLIESADEVDRQNRQAEEQKQRREYLHYANQARDYGRKVTNDPVVSRGMMYKDQKVFEQGQQTAQRQYEAAQTAYTNAYYDLYGYISSDEEAGFIGSETKFDEYKPGYQEARQRYEDATRARDKAAEEVEIWKQAGQFRQDFDREEKLYRLEQPALEAIGYDPKTGKASKKVPEVKNGEWYQGKVKYMTDEEKLVWDWYLYQDESRKAEGKTDLKLEWQYRKLLEDELERRAKEEYAREHYVPESTEDILRRANEADNVFQAYGILNKGLWANVGKILEATVDESIEAGTVGFYNMMTAPERFLGGANAPPGATVYDQDTVDRLALAKEIIRERDGEVPGSAYRNYLSAIHSISIRIPAIWMGGQIGAAVAENPAAAMAMSKASGGYLTTQRLMNLANDATAFATFSGTAYAEGVQQYGMSHGEALLYSTLNGLSEVSLQRVIGGIAAYGGINEHWIGERINMIDNVLLRTAAHFGANVMGEEIEELAQDYLDPLFVTIITGDEYQAPKAAELLDTFLSTLMMVGMSDVGDTAGYYSQSQVRSSLQTMAQQARELGGEHYNRVANQIERYIKQVDAAPGEAVYTQGDIAAAMSVMGKAAAAEQKALVPKLEQAAQQAEQAEQIATAPAGLRNDTTGGAVEDGGPSRAPAPTVAADGRQIAGATGEDIGGRAVLAPTGADIGGQTNGAIRGSLPTGAAQQAQMQQQTPVQQRSQTYENMRQSSFEEAQQMDEAGIRAEIRQAGIELQQTSEAQYVELLEGRIDGMNQALAARGLATEDVDGVQAGLVPTGAEQGEAAKRSPVRAGESAVEDGRQIAGATGAENMAAVVSGHYVENGGQAGLVPTAENLTGAEAAGRGVDYGRAEGFDGGSQRDAGLGAGGQAGGMEGGAGGPVAGGSTAKTDAQKKAAIAALAGPQQSAREIGVRNGGKNQSLQVISDRSLYTADMERAQEKAEAEGSKLTFVKGKLEVWNPTAKKYEAQSAIWQRNADGSTEYFIRADLRMQNAEQLFDHERLHNILQNDPRLRQQLIDYLNDNYTEEQIAQMVDAYIEAYNGIYGTDEESLNKYLEEMLCDVYAEIRRTRADMSPARETVDAFRERIDEAGGRQTEDNGLDFENPGIGKVEEQRYSIEAVQGENQDYPDCVVLDTNLFNGVKPRNWGHVLQDYVYNNLAGETLTIYDENWYSEEVEVVRTNERVKKDGANRDHKVINDMIRMNGGNIQSLAAAHTKEILEVSTYQERNDENSHGWLDKNGWTFRKAYICDRSGRIFEATLNIAEGEERRILYKISNIKQIDKRTAGGNVLSTVAGRSNHATSGSSKRIVSGQQGSVKHFSEEQSRKRIDEDYLRAAKNGDTKTAQRMVDEAAKKAGYTVEVFHGTPEFGFTKTDTGRSADQISFFVTTSPEVAGTYAGKQGVDRVGNTEQHRNAEIERRTKAARELCESIYEELMRTTDQTGADKSAGSIPFASVFNSELFSKDNGKEADAQALSDAQTRVNREFDRLVDQLPSYDSRYDQIRGRLYNAGKELFSLAQYVYDVRHNKEGGTYRFYINTDNILDMGENPAWNYIELGEIAEEFNEWRRAKENAGQSDLFEQSPQETDENGNYRYGTTREVALFAKEAGYSGVRFGGIMDASASTANMLMNPGWNDDNIFQSEDYSDTPSDVYALFDPQKQAKSADPVTYDNDGEPIPLSERFRTDRQGDDARKNEDMRFSAEIPEEDDGLGFTNPDMVRAGESAEQGERIATAPEGPRNDGAGRAAEDGGQARLVPTGANEGRQGAGGAEKQGRGVVERKRENAEKASDQALKNRIRKNEQTISELKKLKGSGNWNAALEGRLTDIQETVNIDRDELQARKKNRPKRSENAELKENITKAEAELRALELAKKAGKWTDAQKARQAELEQELGRNKQALRERQQAQREKKAARKEAELSKEQPRLARKEFRQDALNLFSIPDGRREAMSKVLNDFADRMIEKGSVSHEDRRELLHTLIEQGVEILQADEYYEAIRGTVKSGRIYVNDEVRADFGDNWEELRRRAWANGIYLTANKNDAGIDVWNSELAEAFPGSFDAEATDLGQILQDIVDLADEGRSQKLSLREMMQENEKQTGQSVDDQIAELEQKVDRLIDKFAEKAQLETTLRQQSALRRARERQDAREQAERARQRKQESQDRAHLMKLVSRLSKMRRKTGPEVQAQIDAVLGNLDTMARSITPAGLEDMQALRRAYEEAKEDPNFLGSPYVEARLGRLDKVQIDDLEISDVIELTNTVSALITSIQNSTKLLADERHREISEAANNAATEIENSNGSKAALARWTAVEHLSPTRFLQRLGGWLRGGEMERQSRTLEGGQTRKLQYQMEASRFFEKFVADKENQKWLQKAQGKNAEWIRETVPTIDRNGNPTNVTIEITPMMRVSLYMHRQNNDNLRHIENGGITIPQKKAYMKGNMDEAYARGTRVKLRPEVVYALTRNMTRQELAFAKILKEYFDGFSREKINEVSMQIDGFERAGITNYFHIKTDPRFLAKQPDSVKRDLALESIGSIANERKYGGNPIVLQDASQALTEHIESISQYYGFAIPIRDFLAVMQYTFHRKATDGAVANAYEGSIQELLEKQWGSGAMKYIERLVTDLQQKNSIDDTAGALLAKLRGNLAGASLMFNPAVALSQLASLPGAAQTMGFDGVLAAIGKVLDPRSRIDMDLIGTYSPLLWYRNQGNSTQELGDYLKTQGIEQKLPWLLGWIQKMDTAAIKALWYAAEYRVSKDTDLSPGKEADVKAGTDAYYKAVAEVFNRAIYDTQPNYTEMERPHILRTKNELVKSLTMYKTVPLQYYNMMYEAAGRYHMDKQRAKADNSKENQAALKQSGQFLRRSFGGVLAANVTYVVIKAAVKALTGRDEPYKDEEGELGWATVRQLMKELGETYAGSLIGGSEMMDAGKKIYDAITSGKYSMYGGAEISMIGAMEDTLGAVYNLAAALNKQRLDKGLDAVKDLAMQLAMDTGLPARNFETYLMALARWISPEAVMEWENIFDEKERSDLSKEDRDELASAIRVLMDNRTDDLSDETIEELQRLWMAGGNGAIPAGIPDKFKVGEDEELALGFRERDKFRESWNNTVSGTLEDLLASDLYKAADDEAKTKLIRKLYDYASALAKQAVDERAEPDAWVLAAADAIRRGASPEDAVAYQMIKNEDLKEASGEYLNRAIDLLVGQRVDGLKGETVKELQRLMEAGRNHALPSEIPSSFTYKEDGMDVTYKLTDLDRKIYNDTWSETVSGALDRLITDKIYQNADDQEKEKILQRIYDYAAQTAKQEVLPDRTIDNWVQVGQDAVKAGVKLDEYVLFQSELMKIDAKDENGQSVNGLKNQRGIALLDSMGWTDRQKEQIYLDSTMSSDSLENKEQTLMQAGFTWKQTAEVLSVVGNNWQHAEAIIDQRVSDKAKLQALALYLGKNDYRAASAGVIFSVDLKVWRDARNKADTDGNGSVKQEEATAYLDSLNISREEKAYLWQMLCTSSKSKNNPYSTTLGLQIWEYMQDVELPEG